MNRVLKVNFWVHGISLVKHDINKINAILGITMSSLADVWQCNYTISS